MIISTCYLGAVAVNGVDVVWSFIGSSMAFVIAFILPCGAFIAIEKSLQMFADGEELQSKSIKIAWVILIFSVIGVFVCTLNSVFGSI
jgi:lipopolysaccharide export LptBFGC system permease protein LptF